MELPQEILEPLLGLGVVDVLLILTFVAAEVVAEKDTGVVESVHVVPCCAVQCTNEYLCPGESHVVEFGAKFSREQSSLGGSVDYLE